MDFGLRGKKALVTGASKDTGLAMANSKVAESMFKMVTKGVVAGAKIPH